MIDVAVVGGGPGGLAAAVAAKVARPSARVAVFERAAALDPPRGAVLAVVPNGLRALRAIDPLLSSRVAALDLGARGARAETARRDRALRGPRGPQGGQDRAPRPLLALHVARAAEDAGGEGRGAGRGAGAGGGLRRV